MFYGNLTHGLKIKSSSKIQRATAVCDKNCAIPLQLQRHERNVFTRERDINSMQNSSGTCADVTITLVIRSRLAGVRTLNIQSAASSQQTIYNADVSFLTQKL